MNHFKHCPCGGYRITVSNRRVRHCTVRRHECPGCKSRVTSYELSSGERKALGVALRVVGVTR